MSSAGRPIASIGILIGGKSGISGLKIGILGRPAGTALTSLFAIPAFAIVIGSSRGCRGCIGAGRGCRGAGATGAGRGCRIEGGAGVPGIGGGGRIEGGAGLPGIGGGGRGAGGAGVSSIGGGISGRPKSPGGGANKGLGSGGIPIGSRVGGVLVGGIPIGSRGTGGCEVLPSGGRGRPLGAGPGAGALGYWREIFWICARR